MKMIVPLVIAVLVAGAASVSAQLVFEKTLVEMTVKPDEERVSVDFAFKVVGDKDVEIAEYDAPCSCLEAKISENGKLLWKPGESGTVKGVFSLGTFSGSIDKMIVLRLKGETSPSVRLTLRLHIPELLQIRPAKTLFWEQGAKPEPQSFKITVDHEEAVKIVDVSGTNEQFGIELKTVREGWEYELVVTPKTLDERAFGLVRIRTDSKYVKHQRYQCFTVIRRPAVPGKASSLRKLGSSLTPAARVPGKKSSFRKFVPPPAPPVRVPDAVK